MDVKMDSRKELALNIAKELTVAKLNNSTIIATKDGGENVAEFYEAVFNKVFAIIKGED